MVERERTEAAVIRAMAEWEKAPGHVRVMAGKYMEPVLQALKDIDAELSALRAGGGHG